MIIDKKHCERFDTHVHNTGRRVSANRSSYAYEGHARLSCTFPEGGTAVADLVFKNCD